MPGKVSNVNTDDITKRVEDMELEELYEQTNRLEGLGNQIRIRRIQINEEIARKESIRDRGTTHELTAEPLVIDEDALAQAVDVGTIGVGEDVVAL